MKFLPGLCFIRLSRKRIKIICISLIIAIACFTIISTSCLKFPEITTEQVARDLPLNAPHTGTKPIISRHSYDGSYIRGEKIDSLEKVIAAEMHNIVPGLGDGGVAIKNAAADKDVKAVMKKEAFNMILSDKIPYTRQLPDLRHKLCTNLVFSEDLPSASVVIVFNNEAWSSLMRTVFSVLNRSPARFLKEIILVDDNSSRACLGKQLEYYISTRLPAFVKLIRLHKRSGLIKARLAGAKEATGDVIIFLDAHCEATPYWMEPMLQRIKEEPHSAIIPLIDVIDDLTFEYKYSTSLKDIQVGGFTWSGHFTWFTPDQSDRSDVTAPIRSPTMAGGLFAISRPYFWSVGSYDPHMEVWGGENLEMSFRIWQCGGMLESVPCSRVGHIFRDFHPYTFPGGADTHGINTARLAEVWMDNYKELLYLHRPDLKNASGDVTERKELRNRLQCKNFKWYLDNVYPEKFILNGNAEASGRVFLKTDDKNKICLDTMQREKDDTTYTLGLYGCHSTVAMSQYFTLTKKGELRREEVCAEVSSVENKVGQVSMHSCRHANDAKQLWERLPTGQLRNVASGLCIDALTMATQDLLHATTCNADTETQIWVWDDTVNWD